MTVDKKRMIAMVLLLLAAASIVFALKADAMKINGPVIKVLDEQQTNVEKMTAATAVIATGLAAVPGDMTTPVANKLIDLSGYLVFVLCAVFLEKYLILIIWYLSLAILIPLSLAMMALTMFSSRGERIRKLAVKFLVFAVAIGIAIPASVGISCLMEKTSSYLSVNQRVESIENSSKASSEVESTTESKSLIGRIKSNLSSSTGTLTSSARKWIEKGENAFNDMIEAIALMMITSCVLPILTLMFFIWLLKSLFSINLALPKPGKQIRRGDRE